MKKFFLALLGIALAAMPAFAGAQNLKISGGMNSSYVNRQDFDFGKSTSNINQDFFLTQTTLQVDALTENVFTTVQLINERAWDVNTDGSSDVDINLAYVTLKEMLYSPLTVTIGRQAFSYGNEFIISSAGVPAPADSGIQTIAPDLTAQVALDAVRATFNYEPLVLELFYAKLDDNNTGVAASTDGSDKDLMGVDALYELGDKMKTQVEGYFFAQVDESTESVGTGAKADTTYVPGLRLSMFPIEELNVQAEYAHQFGTYVASLADNRNRAANAVQALVSYQIPGVEKYEPALNYAFTYVSGDVNVNGTDSGRYSGWNSLLENQGFLDGYPKIYNAIFGLSNLFIHEASLFIEPLEDVTAAVGWSGLWLDDEYDAATTLSNNYVSGSSFNINANESYVGSEADVVLTYDYTEDVQLGANLGMFFPGKLFADNNKDAASQAIINVNVVF